MLIRAVATLIVGTAVALVPLSAPAVAALDDPDPPVCSVELADFVTATTDQATARQNLDSHTTDVYGPALAGLRQADLDHASERAETRQARVQWTAARAAFLASRTEQNRQARDEARTAYDLNLVNLDAARLAVVTAKQTVADAAVLRTALLAIVDARKAIRRPAAQALANCLAAHPATGTIGPVTRPPFVPAQVADLSFAPLVPTGAHGPTYRVVPASLCGLTGCAAAESVAAGPDGVLRLDDLAIAPCGHFRDTFEVYREDTNALVASLTASWVPAC